MHRILAALVYQHATSERELEIAKSMDRRIAKHSGKKIKENKSGKAGRGGSAKALKKSPGIGGLAEGSADD